MNNEISRPQKIVIIKSYSAGIGDLLRSSAAWRAMRNTWPEAALHLWFLSQEPGYGSEELIRRHHLLFGFHVSDKRKGGWTTWKKLFADAKMLARQWQPDLIIDFEPNGTRTSILAFWMKLWAKAHTVGISQAPLRGVFYDRSAPSTREYAAKRGLQFPLEFCHRDFVALAALGIERNGAAIELEETSEGKSFRNQLLEQLKGDPAPLLGLNIGCGTRGAENKRPSFDLLVPLVRELQKRHGFNLVLTGAPNEAEINSEFCKRLNSQRTVIDLAGRTNLLQLTGAISACRLFISSDSGPYHMSVGLKVPTLAIFQFPNSVHYHYHPWVECVVAGQAGGLEKCQAAAFKLVEAGTPH